MDVQMSMVPPQTLFQVAQIVTSMAGQIQMMTSLLTRHNFWIMMVMALAIMHRATMLMLVHSNTGLWMELMEMVVRW